MLLIKNLNVSIDDNEAIKNLNLEVNSGQVHALVGPNGSGKSTLIYTLLGHPKCKITMGAIYFNDIDITDLSIEKRSKLGIFLAIKLPKKVPGLQIFTFLKEIFSAFKGRQISSADFKILLEPKLQLLKINIDFIYRNLNENFSCLEKKYIEMLQLLLINPGLAVIEEIDSSMDLSTIKIISKALKLIKKQNKNFTLILVTHHQKIFKQIVPDFVHVFDEGCLVSKHNYKIYTDNDIYNYKPQFD